MNNTLKSQYYLSMTNDFKCITLCDNQIRIDLQMIHCLFLFIDNYIIKITKTHYLPPSYE